MRNLKTVLLSTAAIIAVAAVASHNASAESANKLISEINAEASGKAAPAKGGKQTVTDQVNALKTKTPIKHLVVIFNENESFDHYFGTYPNALNVEGEPKFKAAKSTQSDINNLLTSPALLEANPNLNAANGPGAANPFRLDRTQANTADQGHSYTPEQKAYDGGKNDLFPVNTGKGTSNGAGTFGTTGQVMGYFDGNTVAGFWNFAQNYAMSDNSWTDDFGPSTPGALNMFAGTTNGAVAPAGFTASTVADGQGGFTLINDTDPAGDVCSSATAQVLMTSKNIGDLLNSADIPWGSFVGGFDLKTINNNGTTGCKRSTVSQVVGGAVGDYVPHHIWFQYYTSTANPTHAAPNSIASVGLTNIPGKQKADPANHGYDLALFEQAVGAGNFPAVSFIKQSSFQDGHPGNSDPLDEQTGFIHLINFLQQQPDWDSTAVIIAYDDSDGWYDHAPAPISHGSFSTSDALNGTGNCGVPGQTPEPIGVKGGPVAGRCGPGTRVPLVVISPYAKKNYVSHTLTTQASIPQFIEDNWLEGKRIGDGSFDATTGSIDDMFNFKKKNSTKLILDETTGIVDEKSSITN